MRCAYILVSREHQCVEHTLEIAVVETGFQVSTIQSLRTRALAPHRGPVIWEGRSHLCHVVMPPTTIPPMMCRTSAFSQHLSKVPALGISA